MKLPSAISGRNSTELYPLFRASSADYGATAAEESDDCHQRCAVKNAKLRSALGVTMALLTGISFAVCSMFVTLTGNGGIHPIEISFICNISLALAVLPPIYWGNIRVLDEGLGGSIKDVTLLTVIGFSRSFASIAIIFALTYVPLGNATAISAGSIPIFSAILACIFLKEGWKVLDIVVSILNIVGIVLLTRPTFVFGGDYAQIYEGFSSSEIALGYILTVTSSLGFAVVYVCCRELHERMSLFTMLFYGDFIASVLNLLAMYIMIRPVWVMGPTIACYLTAMALFEILGQWTRFGSLKLERTATVTLLASIEVVIAYVLQFTILEVTPTYLDLIGSAILLLSSAIIGGLTWWKNMLKERKQLYDRLSLFDQNKNVQEDSAGHSNTIVECETRFSDSSDEEAETEAHSH